MENAIDSLLTRWTGWYRIRRAMKASVIGIILGLSFAIGLTLTLLFQSRLVRTEFLLISIISVIICSLAIMVTAFVWKVETIKVARLFDCEYHLLDRTATTVELRASGLKADHSVVPLYEKQIQDTLWVGKSIRAGRRFLAPIPFKQWLLIGLLFTVEVTIIVGGEKFFLMAEEKRALQNAINTEISQIEALQVAIGENDALTQEQRDALLNELQDAKEALSQAESYEQSVAILSSAEQQLESLSDPQAEQIQQTLQDAGNRLLQEGSNENNPLIEAAQNLSEGDLLAASQTLSNLDLENLPSEDLSKIADQLQTLSEALKNADPEFASKLQQASEAIRNGDLASAQSGLQQASEELANTSQRIAGSQAARQAAGQINQGEERLVQAGRSAQSQSTLGTGQGQQGVNPGQSQNQGSSQQPGQDGTSGAGQGSGDQENASGGEAGSTPIDQGNRPGDGGLVPYERIYAPERLGGSDGVEIQLTGSGEEGDVIGLSDTSPEDPGTSYVPYNQVYAFYAQAVRQAFKNGQVPPSFRSIVREYFSSLEP